MNREHVGRASTRSWEEESTWEGEAGEKRTRTECVRAYEGEAEGTSHITYVLHYAGEGHAYFAGIERFEGRLGDRTGTMLVQLSGVFRGGQVQERGMIVAGTGALEGIVGETWMETGVASSYQVTIRSQL